MDTSQIKMQVLFLEAQKAGVEAQLQKLKEIPCGECEGTGRLETKELDPDSSVVVSTRFSDCKACENTGNACGQGRRKY